MSSEPLLMSGPKNSGSRMMWFCKSSTRTRRGLLVPTRQEHLRRTESFSFIGNPNMPMHATRSFSASSWSASTVCRSLNCFRLPIRMASVRTRASCVAREMQSPR